MDRGVPTEAVLDEMRNSDPPMRYLVGTPKGRLNRLEQALLTKDWHQARPGVWVKLLAEDEELYVYAEVGPSQAVDVLPAAGAGGASLPDPEERPGDPADLPPGRKAHRGVRIHRVPGVVPVRHAGHQ